MNIVIVGAGNVGRALAGGWHKTGHRVTFAVRDPDKAGLAELKAQGFGIARTEAASAPADVVVLAVPWQAVPATIKSLGAPAGKIVVDATNYYPQRDGQIPELDDGSIGSSELLARDLPGSRVVKAMNTMSYVRLAREAKPAGAAGRLAIPLAGDDLPAKEIVSGLIDDMGFDPVDAGTLADGRNQQPGTAVYDRPLETEGVRAALAHP